MRINPTAVLFVVFTTLMGAIIGYLTGDVLLGTLIGAASGTGAVVYASI